MKNSDSKLSPFSVLLSATLLSGCVTPVPGGANNIVSISSALSTHDDGGDQLISQFRSICLSGSIFPDEWADYASARSWTLSNAGGLEAAGLTPLKKHVLSIPGGGGRFDEEQIILSLGDPQNQMTLNLERRYSGETTLSSFCEIYSKQEYLRTCEALGKGIGRAPDHNQRYADKNAHFIRWEANTNNMPASISCETAPQSAVLPYSGISLRLRIDHTETLSAKSQFTASQPVSVVSGR
ncbi:MAG: hypothetical protein WBD01_03940 [Salaquimonas sp.]